MTKEFVRFDGLKELEQSLRDVSKHIKGNPLRTAARAMCEPFVEKAKENASAMMYDDAGDIIELAMDKKLIPVSERDAATAKGDSIEVFEVGPRRKKKAGVRSAWFAHWFEFGSETVQAQPFMRPAFEQTKTQVMDAFVAKLTKTLDSAVKRVAKLKA